MTDFSYHAQIGNFDASRRAVLVDKLSQLARLGPLHPPVSPDVQLATMARWEQVKTLPIFMLIGMMGMGALFSQGDLGANLGTWGALSLLVLPLLVLMIKLNQTHLEAFVENGVANGLSRVIGENLA